MPAVTDKLPDLDQLNAELQAIVHKRDQLAEQLLEKCVVVREGVRGARAAIDADLSQGAEAKQFGRCLAHFKAYGSDVLDVYGVLQEEFAAWKKGAEELIPLIQETEAFVSWLDSLAAALNRPAPPIDEQMLRERVRECDEANAWVNSDDALAALKRGDG